MTAAQSLSDRIMQAMDQHAGVLPCDCLSCAVLLDTLVLLRKASVLTWQPIATAPPDAHLNPVLLYWPYWSEGPVIGSREGEDGTWSTEKWLGEDAKDPGPTHWMPLPDPPKARGVDGGPIASSGTAVPSNDASS